MAQQIRQTLTSVRKCAPQDFTGDMLAIGLFKNTKRLPRQFRLLDKAVEGGISNLLKLNDFPGETNETLMLYLSGNVNFRRILLAPSRFSSRTPALGYPPCWRRYYAILAGGRNALNSKLLHTKPSKIQSEA